MKMRYLPAKLFFVVAISSFIIGAAINRHGFPGFLLWHPLIWFVMPRLMPFAVCGLSAAFGAIYLESERSFSRPPNPAFAIGHLATFLVAVWGQVVAIRELTIFLGDNSPDSGLFSLRPFELVVFAGITSIVLFIFSLTRRTRTPVSPA
jgi:hypothetical protein